MTEPAALSFPWLIAPTTPETFFAEYYEKKPLLVRREERPDYYGDLLTLDDIDHAICDLGLHHPSIELVSSTKQLTSEDYTFVSGMIDVVRLYQEFADGATVVLPQLQNHLPKLADLCRAMEARLSSRFQTNIYMTPGASQGFRSHYDSHDVFVLQVDGVKTWRIYNEAIELPYRGQNFDPHETQAGELTEEFELRPGDLFYLPRGYMHDAATHEGGSLHITLGVLHTSWTDVLIETIARAGLRDKDFRKALPPGFADTDFDRTEARAFFKQLVQKLADLADVDETLDHFANDLIATRHPLVKGQMRQVMRIPELSNESKVGRRPHLLLQWAKDDDRVTVSSCGTDVSMPLPAEPALRFALENDSYQVKDLPGLDDKSQVVLTRRLIREGLVQFMD